MSKAVFESHDPGEEPSENGFSTDSQGKVPYKGPDRRRGRDRREGGDRRGSVRFEIDGSDRRSNHGRRQDDPAPNPW